MPTCPACGKELPGEFPFCPFCAAPLTEKSAPATQEERKIVSVLFCDLVGFTSASDAADPEDVRARIRPYHARLRQEIERYGGTVEKFVGDAVMAVFGAPVAHEDDAERAVRAGLRILEAIEELNEADPALSLHVRVGVTTGEAVIDLERDLVSRTRARPGGFAPYRRGYLATKEDLHETLITRIRHIPDRALCRVHRDRDGRERDHRALQAGRALGLVKVNAACEALAAARASGASGASHGAYVHTPQDENRD